jgi:hypothetical protein
MSGDQQLVVDALATALVRGGFAIVMVPFVPVEQASEAPPAGAGVLCCDPQHAPTLPVAESIVAGLRLPWVVVSSAPDGTACEHLLDVGARTVLGHGISVARLIEILDELLQEGAGSPAT